jgi:hypothetical protein
LSFVYEFEYGLKIGKSWRLQWAEGKGQRVYFGIERFKNKKVFGKYRFWFSSKQPPFSIYYLPLASEQFSSNQYPAFSQIKTAETHPKGASLL